jgi:hypothetical protein
MSHPRVLDHLLAASRIARDDDGIDIGAIREAQRLHELRNFVQHDGLIPSVDDVARSRLRALDLLEWLASEFLGTPLASLSRAALIRSEAIRAAVESAERAAGDRQWNDAGAELAVALIRARAEFREGEPYRRRIWTGDVGRAVRSLTAMIPRDSRSSFGTYSSGSGTRDLQRLLEEVVRHVERVEDVVEARAVGARASDYAGFKRRVPLQHIEQAVDWSGTWIDPPLTEDEYLRAYEFVVTTALQWQQFPPPPEPDSPPDEVDIADAT